MQKKYTLPRHTNLANISTRFGAFFIDFAILFALVLVAMIISQNIYWFNGGYDTSMEMQNYVLDSELCYLKTNPDGSQSVAIYDTTDKYELYEEHVSYYYLNYLTGNVSEAKAKAPNYNTPIKLSDGSEILPKDYYTVSWYNLNVLGINEDDPDRETSSLYFTYQKNEDGSYNKDVVGIPKSHRYNADKKQVVELTREDITIQYKAIYEVAYRHLENQDFYLEVANRFYLCLSLCATISLVFAGLINYVLLPYILKNGQTVGKKILKLGLANYEGYAFKSSQLWMRIVPYVVTSCALLIPVWGSFFVIGLIILIMVLVSFALMMASPKRAALHDFTARTLVIDLRTSIIFNNFVEEAEYIEKEDNLPKEVIAGEEPELRYEK